MTSRSRNDWKLSVSCLEPWEELRSVHTCIAWRLSMAGGGTAAEGEGGCVILLSA